MLPSMRRAGVLGHATNPVYAKAMLDEVLRAGAPTGIEIQPVVMIRGPDELESAFATLAKERADAVVVQGSLAIKPVTDAAIKYRIPAASTPRAFADIGGLMSFGADGPSSMPCKIFCTSFVPCRILKTAKTIGLSISDTFLQRVDALIE
jgi:putative ABC transport system substrate-binding protein